MPLEKKTLSFALLKGIDEKSSDAVREPDALSGAKNVDFGKKGQLKKRGGFISADSTLTRIQAGGVISKGKALSRYGNETLVFDGSDLYSKITGSGLLQKGTYVPCTIENRIVHRNRDRRQGNAQIAENNGIRVHVWEEYLFGDNKYKTYIDIEHIATGAMLISTTEMSSTTITTTDASSSPTNALYKIAQPQCAPIGSYIFIVYADGANLRYRYVLCSSVANATAVSGQVNLYETGTTNQVVVDTVYPLFQIDKFSGTTHSDAIVLLRTASSNNLKVQYLTASGATLSMPSTVQTIATAYFATFGKAALSIPSGIFLKCLNDETDGNTYSIIVGATLNAGSRNKVGIVQLKDNLTAQIVHTHQDTYPDSGGTAGDLWLLNGTAGTTTAGSATINILVGLYASANNTGVQKTVVPEHHLRRITISRGGAASAIAMAATAAAFNTSLTSDFFHYDGDLYAVVTQVNDNALYFDPDGSTQGMERGLNNNSMLINWMGELVGALKSGSAASCLTSEYATVNPGTLNSGAENRRLVHGVQRATSRNSGTAFVFGASKFNSYAYHAAGTYAETDYPDNVFGVSVFEVDFAPPRTLASVDIENSWLGSGGFIHGYDGDTVFENNFLNYPSIKSTIESTVTSLTRGFSDSKVIKSCVLYSWTDANGNEQRSLPSQFTEITLTPGKVADHGTITGGSGYTTAVGVAVGGGSGSGCIVTTTVVGAAVTDVTITDPGTGYVNGESLTIPGGTSGAFVAVVSGKSYIQHQIYVPAFSRKSGITAELYRTDHSALLFYLVASIPLDDVPTSSVETYTDFPLDETAITARPGLYTENFPGTGFAGCCTDLVRHQNKLISAGVDDEVSVSSTIIEGVAPGFPITYPYSFRLSGDPSTITGVESNLDNLLVFTGDNVFYVSGSGPNIIGQGSFAEPRLFASDQGAVSGTAHTDSPLGVFYQADRGIYLIGRDLSVNYVGTGVEDTVGVKLAVSMVRHDDDNTVRIMLQAASPGSSGADRYCIFNYYYKQWVTYEIGYQSSAHQVDEIYDGTSFQRLTADGKQYKQSTTDFRDNNTAGSLVIYDAEIMTGFISPSGLMRKDRIYRYMILGSFLGSHTLEVEVYNDYSGEEGDPSQEDSTSISSAPAGLYLYRAHLENQKSRSIQLLIKLNGTTSCASIEGIALEVGVRPDKTAFKTIEGRTM